VTIAKRPFVLGGDGSGYRLIWVFGKSEYFFNRGLTGICDLPVRQLHPILNAGSKPNSRFAFAIDTAPSSSATL
jgi:hypothetical protein